jgi:hypothetical protein
MDRMVIESALSDVNEIFLSGVEENSAAPFGIVLGFKATHTDLVLNAFNGLKDTVCDNDLNVVICKTRLTGIYDLEIKTEGLDEPIRIMNKAISHETLGAIEDRINDNGSFVLTTNVSEQDNIINMSNVSIKACDELA